MKTVRAIPLVLASALFFAAAPLANVARAEVLCTIPVKILVDQKEPTVQKVWEQRYRDRIAAASKIFEKTCGVRFRVAAVGTWTSDNKANDIVKLIEEFERKVKPAPAQLAIGFTGQYYTLLEDNRIGGTHGPFRTHILIREWSHQVTEPERLEILVHEMGHYLGAAHSSERQSVMRPDISDRQSRARDFQISFDARNAEAMRLVGEQIAKRPVAHLCQLSASTKGRLRSVYRSLAASLPNDPAAPRYLAMLDQSLGMVGDSPTRLKEVVAGARSVTNAVSAAAAKNRLLSKKGPGVAAGKARLEGDELTEYYVRQAAAAARRLPPKVAVPAFLVGLGVALDDSTALPNSVVVGALWQQIESPSARTTRLKSLGEPTMRGRRDLAQHFAVSAALTALVGPQNTEEVGILKEMTDSREGRGFSFADLSADIAGIRFAAAIADGRIPLSRLESRFIIRDFFPDVSMLREGITWTDFTKQYGLPPDDRLTKQRQSLHARVLAMPGYRVSAK